MTDGWKGGLVGAGSVSPFILERREGLGFGARWCRQLPGDKTFSSLLSLDSLGDDRPDLPY